MLCRNQNQPCIRSLRVPANTRHDSRALGKMDLMSKMLRIQLISMALLGSLVFLGCGADADNPSSGGAEQQIEIFSWWIQPGEADALQASLDIHKKKYPNVTVVNLTGTNAVLARSQMEQKMRNANPPDTFQANIGADLLRWVKFNGVDTSESKLEPIGAELSPKVFYPRLVQHASMNDVFYGVPMNIHRINSLFFNKHVFQDLGIDEPTDNMSLDDFNQLCALIKAKGKTPISIGYAQPWVIQELVFEHILPGIAGADYYEEFWAGNKATSDREIAQTLQEALLLKCGPPNQGSLCPGGYFNDTASSIDWDKALDLLQSGEAAMSPLGDWAKGYFEVNGWKADADFGVVQFPGAHKVFIYTADSFPLPKKQGTSHTLAMQLLQTFASIESQVAFNHVKGSIPARSDIDLSQHPDSFDSMQQRTYAALQTAEQGLAMSGLIPSDALTTMATTLSDSLNSGEIDTIQKYLDKNYATLSHL